MILKKYIAEFRRNTQLQNSVYLLLGSLATAGFGFIFWIIVARVFDEPTVGIATTLISLSSLISLLSLAGFDSSFVRFLPRSNNKNSYTNSGIVVSTILSILFSIACLVFVYISTPSLYDIVSQPLTIVLFIILTVASSLNLLTNSVFLAYRRASYVFVVNTLFNIVKVVLPFAFISYGALGIFTAAGVAQAVGLILSIWFMKRKFGYNLRLSIDISALRQTFRYTFAVYVGSVLNLLPPTILPLLIAQQIGLAATAYFYMAFSIANIIFTIAYSALQSAFAESAHNETELRANIIKGIRLSLLLMTPILAICFFFGGYILALFGASYAANAAPLLQIFCVSAFAVMLYSAFGAVLKISHDITSLIISNIVYAFVIIAGSFVFIPLLGINGIGYAWICGNVMAILVGAVLHIRFRQNLFAVQRAK